MTMRHKLITPAQCQAVKAKRRGAGQHKVALSPEQKESLTQWQKDFKKVFPAIQQSAGIAQRLFQEVMDAPIWQINEGPQLEEQVEPPKPWTVGHAKVEYVNRIETKGDSE